MTPPRPRSPGRPRRLLALAAATAVALLAGCSPDLPQEGGRDDLEVLLPDDLTSLDPVQAMGTASRVVSGFLYDTLVRMDVTTGEYSPGLAESWELSANHLHFVIREGATCDDGSTITAGTVARNFERYQDPATNAPTTANYFGSADFTVTSDDTARTVDVDLTTPMPFLAVDPRPFDAMGIVCDAGLDDPDPLSSKTSAGSTPYRLAEYVNGSHLTLERRDDYDGGPDDVDVADLPKTVRLQLVAESNTQANLLIGGDADAAMLGPEELGRLDESDFTFTTTSTSVEFLMFNQRAGLPTADLAVRTALAQALDRKGFQDVQGKGTGRDADFLRAPGKTCVDQERIRAVLPTGGADAARATLERAGYVAGADGMYAKDGVPLQVALLGHDLTRASAEYVTAAWTTAGIATTYDDRPVSQAAELVDSGQGWDAAFVSMEATHATGLRPFLDGPPPPDGANWGSIDNPTYHRLQQEAAGITDPEALCATWIDAETSVVEQVNWVPMMAIESKLVTRTGLSMVTDGAVIYPDTLRESS